MFSLEFSVIHQNPVFGPLTPYGRCGCVAIPNVRSLRVHVVGLIRTQRTKGHYLREWRWVVKFSAMALGLIRQGDWA